MGTDPRSPLQFGDFILDVEQFELRRAAALVALQPKTFALLAYFCAHPRRLLGKDELLRELWPGVIVTENSLSRCVKDLRKALGDDVQEPRYIETVPRMGYRFLIEPQAATAGSESGVRATTAPAPTSARTRRTWTAPAAIAFVLAASAAVWSWRAARVDESPATPPPTLAVLPFVVDPGSAAAAGANLGAGFAEDLIQALRRDPGLRVLARTSSFAFDGSPASLADAGRALDADWLLTGRVSHQVGALRIEFGLHQVGADAPAWSRSVQREAGQWPSLLAETAAEVAARILHRPVVPVAAVTLAPERFDAHLAYLVGREHLERRRRNWRDLALQAFERALALDPAHAQAHAGVAIMRALRGPGLAQDELALADAAVVRALELDPGSALAYAAQGLVRLQRGHDAAAEQALRQALNLDPALGAAHNWLSIALARQGRWDESQTQLERGLALDPINPVLLENRGAGLFARGDLDGARRMYERLLWIPDVPPAAPIRLGELALSRGRLVEALGHAESLERLATPDRPAGSLIPSAVVYSRLGLCAEAQARLRAARSGPVDAGWRSNLEVAYRALGRPDELAALLPAETGPVRRERRLLGRVAMLAGDDAGGAAHLLAGAALGPTPDPNDTLEIDSDLALVFALQRLGRNDEARSLLATVQDTHARAIGQGRANSPNQHYLNAMAEHLAGRPDAALAAMGRAQAQGWNDVFTAWHDRRWNALREHPGFRQRIDAGCARVDAERRQLAAERALSLSEPSCPPQAPCAITN